MMTSQYEQEIQAQELMKDVAFKMGSPTLFIASGLIVAAEMINKMPPAKRKVLAKLMEKTGKKLGE